MPIFCSIERREKIIRESKKIEKSIHYKNVNIKETETIVAPEIPLHLSSSSFYSNYDKYVFVTNETINLVRRGEDYYQKIVFTYTSKLDNKIISLSGIEIDEEKSKFYFSSDDNLGGCTAERGKEYNYKYKI